ncbi:MAG: hypothetical protein ACR2IK_09510 [Chloroflexota bacterium]
MFGSAWTWVGPLLGAAWVFVAVLWTTPPGFGAIAAVVFGPPRGTNADSAAYVVGSASSLALIALLVLALVSVGIEFALRLRDQGKWFGGPLKAAKVRHHVHKHPD